MNSPKDNEFNYTCANKLCRKHLEPINIKGFIESIGNVCGPCWRKLHG